MRRIIIVLAVLKWACGFAQPVPTISTPAYGSAFQEIKTYQEQALSLGGTKAQRMEVQRNILKARYGETGVERMFQGYSPNPALQGIGKTTRLAASGSPNQAKGYKRTLLFEKQFTTGGKFKVLATDKIINTRFGLTDVDLWLKHRQTGEDILVEVKDVKPAGQNLREYKVKVQRLTDYAKRHGGRVVFLNRYGLRPEIKEFAWNRGGLVYENVVTGKLTGQKQGNTPFREMETDLGQKVAAGTGTEPSEPPPYAKARRDATALSRGWPEEKPLPTPFHTAQKLLRRGGTIILVLTEGYIIRGYATGRLSEREFVTAQSSIAAGGLGAWGGMVVGAELGALAPPPFDVVTIPAGGLIGGILGGIVGGKVGEMAAAGFYGRLDRQQQREVEAFIYQQFGVNH